MLIVVNANQPHKVAGLPVRLVVVGATPFAPNGILVATKAARNNESYRIVWTETPVKTGSSKEVREC